MLESFIVATLAQVVGGLIVYLITKADSQDHKA